ncbi:restriction endonuclease subunit S [Fibrella sp. HMF5335]|uniref:Restriction endonuclease subunit S n=1 Tax=Fibrella rubiginis TaxID=2817060 RepID=A0A939GFU3_9BACT|nr:restriction endonuclease subunit S [Fibrella rubiginis]MBO0938209.1 restriction endonuclease subunit S [Fibrella rubiginis]
MTTAVETNIPVLRFPEFSGEWVCEKLGNVSSWKSGGTPSKENATYWNGDIPWISASSMRGTKYHNSEIKLTKEGLENGSRLAKKGSFLILVRGSMLFKTIPIGIATRDVAFNQDVKAVEIDESISKKYALYWFLASEHKILSLVVGTGIGAGKLELDDLKNLQITLPTFTEQQKIASFLTAIDDKIELLTKKKRLLEQYKQGVMQQLFSQKLRFKDANGETYPDWEEKQLGDVFQRLVRKNSENNLNVLTISAQYGLISQTDFFNKSVASEDLTGYYLLHKGDFAYNKSTSNGYPVGAIKRLTAYKKGVVSTLYICFSIKEDYLADYFDQYFDAGFLNQEIQKIAQEGARSHGLLNVSVTEFFRDVSMIVPSEQEQQKIAKFLTNIDDKINAVNQQIEGVKTYKKGLLQRLFV